MQHTLSDSTRGWCVKKESPLRRKLYLCMKVKPGGTGGVETCLKGKDHAWKEAFPAEW